MSEISILSPINHQDFCFPKKQGEGLFGQDQRAVQGCQGHDCRPTQDWNGLQDHRQAAWWEGDNSWCDYLKMDETLNYLSISVQDLTSWSLNDHENGEESAQNYTRGSCQ